MINDSAKEYLNKVKQKKTSEFLEYQDDIFYLKNNDISIKDIHSYLVDNFDLKSSYQNLSQWIKRQDTNKISKQKDTVKSDSKITNDKNKNLDIEITKYNNVDGALKKHNLDNQITRSTLSFQDAAN